MSLSSLPSAPGASPVQSGIGVCAQRVKVVARNRARASMESNDESGNYIFDHMAMNIRQAEVASRMAECKPFMIKAEQGQNRCVEVVNVNGLFSGLESKFIGGAINSTTFDPAASQPNAESIVIM